MNENSRADYEFDWDDAKAESNLRKHGVAFSEAMSVLADPLARTRYDEDHSEQEERWVRTYERRLRLQQC